jgi:hypothetical protein
MTASTDAPAPAPARGQTVPDFFIVGHHKSGTTALYQMLRRHPQIFMPAVKEPRYLAADLRALVPSAPGQPETLQEYLALFAGAREGQRVGEASPSYLRSREAARAIAELQPNARIIALFREPASFVRSLHLHLLEEGVERERDLATAVRNERVERNGHVVLRYSDHVRYSEQLRRYRDVFAPEQLLVLVYEEFRADNRATLGRVLRFLEVDDDLELPAVEANPSYAVRSPRLNGALRSLGGSGRVARTARRTLVTLVPRRLRRGALGLVRRHVLYGPPPEPDERVMAELRERYRPEVEAFGEYLGRDLLTLWGYR